MSWSAYRCRICLPCSLPFRPSVGTGSSRLPSVAVLSLVASLLTACGVSTEPISFDASLPDMPLVDREPIAVGVYYSPRFRTLSLEEDARYMVGWASVELFDQILSTKFETVVQLAPMWPSMSPPVGNIADGASAKARSSMLPVRARSALAGASKHGDTHFSPKATTHRRFTSYPNGSTWSGTTSTLSSASANNSAIRPPP